MPGRSTLISSFATDTAGNLYITDLDGESLHGPRRGHPQFRGRQVDRRDHDQQGRCGRRAWHRHRRRHRPVERHDCRQHRSRLAGSWSERSRQAERARAPTVSSSCCRAAPTRRGSAACSMRSPTTTRIPRSPSTATRTLTYTLVDGAGTTAGGQDTLSFTSQVTLNGVNDAPSGQDNGAGAVAGVSRTFTAADFSTGFSDPAEGRHFRRGQDHHFALDRYDQAWRQRHHRGRPRHSRSAHGWQPHLHSVGRFGWHLRRLLVPGEGRWRHTRTAEIDLDPTPATFTFTIVSPQPVVDLNGADSGTSTTIGYTDGGPLAAIAPSATVIDPEFDRLRRRGADRRVYRQRPGQRPPRSDRRLCRRPVQCCRGGPVLQLRQR